MWSRASAPFRFMQKSLHGFGQTIVRMTSPSPAPAEITTNAAAAAATAHGGAVAAADAAQCPASSSSSARSSKPSSSMYIPNQYKVTDAAITAELIRAHPFASVISTDDNGFPYVTHIPLHLQLIGTGGDDESAAPQQFRLLGHISRANPHWKYLKSRPQALVTFMGPHAYLSPSVYPDLQHVPTWNYIAVHCKVTARLLDDAATKDALLKQLIGDHEPPYADQWRGLDESYTRRMLAGIVGFELDVTEWVCKIKVNQHSPSSHEQLQVQYKQGNENQQQLAQWLTTMTEKKTESNK